VKALAFGGAFNPPTIAHIECAHAAMKQAGYDKVIFVPSKMSYVLNDQGKDFSFTDEQRRDMLTKIAFDRAWMDVDPGELESKTQPRTYETLKRLGREGYQVSLLFGSDKLEELETGWKYVNEIAHEFGIVCMSRSHQATRKIIAGDPYLRTLAPYITLVEPGEAYQDISSTEVRQLFHALQNDPGNAEIQKKLKAMVPEELDGLKEFL
jgi:nicotinate-nucleotide adenylyltransferase